MLSWLYDIKLDSQGIRFVLFSVWTIYLLRFENIEAVKEISIFSIGPWNAYNFKNRFGNRSFLIETKQGWFARKVLVTPETSEEFISFLMNHHVKIHLRP